MRIKLRKIHVENVDFFWTITHDKNAVENDYILLRVWIMGQKGSPWITVRYHFHNHWLFFGELVAIQTPEEKERAEKYFQFKPLTPQKVAKIIKLAMNLLNEEYADKLHHANTHFYVDNEGYLQWDIT